MTIAQFNNSDEIEQAEALWEKGVHSGPLRSFSGKELLVFKIAEELATWERFEVDKGNPDLPYDEKKIEKSITLIRKLNDELVPNELEQLINKYKECNTWDQSLFPYKVYNTFRKRLERIWLFLIIRNSS